MLYSCAVCIFPTLNLSPPLVRCFFSDYFLSPVPPPAQNPVPQTQSPTASKLVRHDSVEVVAHLTPEEVEEGKLNDAYERIA